MKVKVGDNVKVLTGNDKGKVGKVLKTLKKDNKVIVEGIHIVKRHMKPNRMNEAGGIITKEAPIHASNVKVLQDKKEVKEVKAAEKKTAKKAEKTTKTTKTTKKTKESEK